MDCKCIELSKLDKIPSQGMYRYSREHLKLVSVDKDAWEAIWECPITGVRFLKRSLHPEYHGGGIPIWTVINNPDLGK